MSSHQHRARSGPDSVQLGGTTGGSRSSGDAPLSNQFLLDNLEIPSEARGPGGDILAWLRMATAMAGVLTRNLSFVSDKLHDAKLLLMAEWSGALIDERDALTAAIVAADAEVVDTLVRRTEAFASDAEVDPAVALGFGQRAQTVLHDLCPANPAEGGYPPTWQFSLDVKADGIARMAVAQGALIASLEARGLAPDDILLLLQRGAAETAEGFWEEGGRPAGPFRTAAGTGGSFDWCGMFTVSQYAFSGLDGQLRAGFWETGNVADFFDAGRDGAQVNASRVPLWIEVTDDPRVDGSGAETDQNGRQWMNVREYHAMRGSERSWLDASGLTAANIRAGDAVLCGADADAPSHIAMVHSVLDGETLEVVTIEGNASGIVHVGEGGAGGPDAIAEVTDTELTELAPTDAFGVSMNDFVADDAGALQSTTGHHFFLSGRGRPSLVDFEEHAYAIARPTASAPANEQTGSGDY